VKGFDQKIINLRKSAAFRRLSVRCVVCYLSLVSVLASDRVHAQIQGPGGASQGGASAQAGSSSPGGFNTGGIGTSYGGQGGASGASSALSQSPFSGSVPEGKATSEILPITFKEAIDRALRNNLGVLLGSDNTLNARGQRWHELSALLPHVSASASQSAAQIDLAAEGFRFNFAGIPKVIGPVGIWQSQVSLSQSLFDFNAIERTRGTSANLQAVQFAYKDARDTVVLAAGNAYLETLAGAARVETEQAQVITAQAVYDRSVDQQKAGVSPAIDALRARVELQSQQQQLIVAKNNYAKQKLALARVIGLPPGQEFALTDKAPYEPLVAMGVEQALQRAYTSRADYMAAAQQVRASEYLRRAATAEHYPTLSIAGDYGDAGIRPGSSHGVFQAGITLDIPIFAGGKTHGDVLQAEASLRQSRQQLENLRGQIDQEVRSALLDLAAAAEQVEVARSTVDLANQTLTQSRDRFAAGVTDNLEVVQAQESLAAANETYISSLYAHNLAKVELARAIGFAEQGVRLYLQGK
jgi:outer membrane protein TolC